MALKDFLEEAAIMKEMKHPNLVQLLGKCFTCCWKCLQYEHFISRDFKFPPQSKWELHFFGLLHSE